MSMIMVLFVSMAMVFMVPVFAADKKYSEYKSAEVPKPLPPVESKSAPVPAPAAVNPITQAAVQSGTLACTSRINQVSAFLTGNTNSGAYLFFSKVQPDQRIFSTSLELLPANAPAMYASASFASSPAGGCGAVYDAVEYSARACMDLENDVFRNLKRTGVVKKDIVILDGGAMKVFLMPAGAGCVVIRKEIVQ
jgi:hypothetical protein